MMKILSFGEILWDIFPKEKFIGGAPFNFAAHLANHGEEVYMLTAVGDDELGKDAVESIKNHGISEKYVFVSQHPTGRCSIFFENGNPKYELLENTAFDFIPYVNIDEVFKVIYFGTLALREKQNKDTLIKLLENNSFSEIFVDINIRPPFYTDENLEFAFSKASIIKISLEELPIAAKLINLNFSEDLNDFSALLAQKYPNLKIIIITMGENGAFAFDTTLNQSYTCPAEKSVFISAVGAGDSFSAAFLHKYLKRLNIQSCMEYASKVAGFVVSKYEAVPKYTQKDFQ